MSGPRVADAAVEAGARALASDADDEAVWPEYDREAELVLTAALPHIRRAVIEELVEKYEAKAREGAIYIDGVRQRSMFDKTVAVLRAEMEGGDRA